MECKYQNADVKCYLTWQRIRFSVFIPKYRNKRHVEINEFKTKKKKI